jgi:hypothetical protein
MNASTPLPHRRRLHLAAALALGALVLVPAALAARQDLSRFVGSYVGVAEVVNLATGEREDRHMDIEITPHDRYGLRLNWVNVTLVDGRRDVPGVERRVQSVLFQPAQGRDFLVEAAEGTPFRERERTRPMQGDPVRWAKVDDDRLHVYAFVVLDDGRYELQVYDRVLTETGLDILFERIVDGEVLRRITGSTVRADGPVGED